MIKEHKSLDDVNEILSGEPIRIYCLNLANLSRPILFITLSALVFASFLSSAYLVELMFTLPGFKNFSLFLTLFQFFFYSCLSIGESILRNETSRKIPIRNYLLLAFVILSSTGLSNLSIGYLNYATILIFKSCKLIPVLIGGILIQGKRFNKYEISATILMTFGILFFALADVKVKSNYSLQGIILIIGSLCADAVIGNYQEKQMKFYNASNNEIVLYTYSIGFVYLLTAFLLFFDLKGSIEFWLMHPKETFLPSLIMSFATYTGTNAVLHLVKNFGVLIAATVSACRRIVTIILSFILFSKPFTFQYVWSGLLVFSGIYLNLLSKNHQSFESKLKLFYQKIHKQFQKKNLEEGIISY